MNSSLNCAANHLTLDDSLVSQGLSFRIYKIKEREVPVSNQYKFQFQGFYYIGFYVADLQYYIYKKG